MYRCCTYGYWMLLDLYSVLGLIQHPWCTSNIGMCSFWVWMSLNRIHVATRYSQLIKVVLLLVEKKSCSSWSHCTSFTSTRLYTSPETNMNTKNDGLVKGDSFKIRQFLVFILNFGGIHPRWTFQRMMMIFDKLVNFKLLPLNGDFNPSKNLAKMSKMAKRNLSPMFFGVKKIKHWNHNLAYP